MTDCNCSTSFHDFFSGNLYTWCTNCGNYGIHAAIKRALVAECSDPKDTLLCFDIGCNGNGSDKIGGYRFHGLHGRVIPFACGAANANSKVKVVAMGGDGGTMGEGINHLVNAIRGNFNVTFILHNNLNYGLTQGQASSTTKPGMKMTAAPDGITSDPIHVMRFVLGLRPTFAARSFSGDIKHMAETIQAGLQHQGFSFIEIYQSCPTYNKATPHEWYQQRIYDVRQRPGYDKHDIHQAMAVADDIEDHIALGVLYEQPESLPFMQRQANRTAITTELVNEVARVDVSPFLAKLR